MEKQCLVTTLKAKTENTDLEVYGYMKIKISRIPEENMNDDPWNEFFVKTTGEVKVIGDGLIYRNLSDRNNNVNGAKSITINNNSRTLYCSNGDYELLVPKYSNGTSISRVDREIRSDNISINWDTFKNSSLEIFNISFVYNPKGFIKYPLNTYGSLKNLPSTLKGICICGDSEHTYNLEELSHISNNLTEKLLLLGKNSFYGNFDLVKFPKIIKNVVIAFQGNLTGTIKNVPISLNSNINFGLVNVTGELDEVVERIAKNAKSGYSKYIYCEANHNKITFKGSPISTLPSPGFLYITADGAGEVKVYGNEARTNLLGTYNVTSGWTYSS